MKKVKTLFKNLSASIVLSITSSLAIVPSIVGTTLSETAEALTVDDIFNFAKSKGIKERSNISEYESLLDYDKNTAITAKCISKVGEEYKANKILECMNTMKDSIGETEQTCIAIFLDRIFHGLDKINYKNGLDEMITFLVGNKKDQNQYDLGQSYVTGFIVQEMLYNIAHWSMCWSLEQNYDKAVERLMRKIDPHKILSVLEKDLEKTYKKQIETEIKEDIFSCFRYLHESNSFGILENTVHDVYKEVINIHRRNVSECNKNINKTEELKTYFFNNRFDDQHIRYFQDPYIWKELSEAIGQVCLTPDQLLGVSLEIQETLLSCKKHAYEAEIEATNYRKEFQAKTSITVKELDKYFSYCKEQLPLKLFASDLGWLFFENIEGKTSIFTESGINRLTSLFNSELTYTLADCKTNKHLLESIDYANFCMLCVATWFFFDWYNRSEYSRLVLQNDLSFNKKGFNIYTFFIDSNNNFSLTAFLQSVKNMETPFNDYVLNNANVLFTKYFKECFKKIPCAEYTLREQFSQAMQNTYTLLGKK